MSGGIVTPGRAPRTAPEWAREVQARLRQSDRAGPLRVGEWVLSTGEDGNLIAQAPGKPVLEVGKEPDIKAVAEQMRGVVVTPAELAEVIAGEEDEDAGEEDPPTPLERVSNFFEQKWAEAQSAATSVGRQAANLLDLFDAPFDVPNIDFDPVQTFLKGPSQHAQNVLDDFAELIGGFSGSFFNRDTYRESAANTANQLQALSSAVAALQQQSSGNNNGGKSYYVDFTTMDDSTNMPPMFDSTLLDFDDTPPGTGQTYGIIDGKAHWTAVGTGHKAAFNLYNAGVTDSDYQLIGCVFASGPGKRTVPGAFPWTTDDDTTFYSQDEIVGRWGVNGGIRAQRVGTGDLALLYDNGSGGLITLATKTGISWKANTVYYLQCGVPGNLRTYRVLEGSQMTPLLTFTDTAAVTAVGPNNRGGGWLSCRINNTNSSPVSAFLLRDNTPAPIIGSRARVYRSLTTSVSQGTGDLLIPPDLFDSVAENTSDITWTPGQSEVHMVLKSAAGTAGTWTYSLPNGETTAAIAYNATAATVQTAIRALPSVGSTGVTVAAVTNGWAVTFAGNKAMTPIGVPSVAGTLTGATIGVTRTTIGQYQCAFQVTKEGEYVVSGRIDGSASSGKLLVLYRNGGFSRRGTMTNNTQVDATWTIYLRPGDYVQLGSWLQDANTIVGVITGDKTYFEIARVTGPN